MQPGIFLATPPIDRPLEPAFHSPSPTRHPPSPGPNPAAAVHMTALDGMAPLHLRQSTHDIMM